MDIKLDRIGETNYSNDGHLMTIIDYFNANNITIEFEDGEIVTHKRYYNFKIGKICWPKRKNRVGEESIAYNGQKMTIIKYRNVNDLDVQFEDGSIVEHILYCNFLSGEVRNVNVHIGETSLNSKGEKMTIKKYRSSYDIDIEFEDGTIVENRRYEHFINGRIAKSNKS